MAAAIGVRSDGTAADSRQFTRRSGAPHQVGVGDYPDSGGGRRSEAATVAGVTLQIVRDWVLRFNANGPDGLTTRKAPGRAAILSDEQRSQLAAVVEAGLIPAAHGVVRWWLCDLAQWVWHEFELSVTRHTLGRELRAMGYRKLSARPRHRGQKSDDIADCKKLRCPSGADQAAVQILRRHRRPLLLRLEQARRPTLAHHVPRNAAQGTGVLINANESPTLGSRAAMGIDGVGAPCVRSIPNDSCSRTLR